MRHRGSRVLAGRRVAVASLAAALVGVLLPAPSAQAVPADAWWYTDMNLSAAWKISKGAGVTVAVVDSGVKATLADLRGQVLPGKDYTGASPDGREDAGAADNPLFGHGTNIAAMVAGTGAGSGLTGVAPQAKILPVRVGTRPDTETIAAAIRWSVDHGARIVNLSLAGDNPCPAQEQDAVDYAVEHEVIVVAGAGNDPNLPVGAPANCVGALAVGGIEPGDSFEPWPGESSGPELDFVAAGDKLQGLYLNGQLAGPVGSGTSMATALVSGTFALLRAKFPRESARQIVTRALWNVHNGLGGKVFAKRINDKLGYGEILPYYALTTPPPRGAANPIYDEIAAHLPTTSASPSPSSTPPARSSSSPAAATHSDAKSSGPSAALIAGIVAVVLVAAIVIAFAARRRKQPVDAGAARWPPAGGTG
jgi:subtilisin family serine protease